MKEKDYSLPNKNFNYLQEHIMSTIIHHEWSHKTTPDKTALWIARTQPLHLGHIDAIKQTFAAWIEKVLIGIWSANKRETADNPFSANERKEMLIDVLKAENLLEKCSIYYLMDFGDNDLRRKNIDTEVGKFEYIISDNEVFPNIFPDKKIIEPVMRIDTRGTIIRNAIFHKDYTTLKEYLHPITFETLERIDAYSKIQKIFGPEMMKPKNAVDIVIKNEKNESLLIERKYPPFGFALAWWMLDYGEKAEQAALREWCEELGGKYPNDEIIIEGNAARRWWLHIQIVKPLGYRDDPQRDPRWHIITFPFEVKIISGEVKAADDAKETFRKSKEEIEKIPKDQRAFPDHQETILDTYPQESLTDFYLNEDNATQRLINDYDAHGGLAISYDFDGTIYDRHKQWITFNNVIEILKEAKQVLGNSYFNVFTANDDLELVKNHINTLWLPLDGINQDPPFRTPNGRKPFYSILLDDRAGLPSTYRQLKAVIEYAKTK